MPLTDLAIKNAKPKTGADGKAAKNRLSDGDGLYLVVSPTGAKKWVFMFDWGDKRPEMGLGSYPEVSGPAARDERDRWADVLRAGRNPIGERDAMKAMRSAPDKNVTFAQFAEQHIATLTGPAEKTREQFLAMVKGYTGSMAGLTPATITKYHVAEVLDPYWHSRPYTGRKLRQNIHKVLTRAFAFDLIAAPWHNPADVELVNAMLGRQGARRHNRRPSLPYAEAAEFMKTLRQVGTVWAFAAEFTILTLSRSKESRGLIAGEVDFAAKVWTVPAERMKMKEKHRVPLNDAAVTLLLRLGVDKMRPDRAVFLNPWTRELIGGDAITNVVTDIVGRDEDGVAKASLHGWRRTFRNWVKHSPNYRREFAELCLAHRIGSDVEHHYWDDDALEERRLIMCDWGSFLAGNVIEFKRQAAA